ncbi:MAG TPA: hypothetical protein VEZ41_16515 [Allosphingosinicella sp.]|nr:hypothetical protein [Allosphingosinicella sp.]
MGARSEAVPDVINIRYARHGSGLWCAFSDDLPGLMVMGPDFEQVQEDLLTVASELIEERTGEKVSYRWNSDKPESGFVSVDRMALEPLAA